MNSSNDSTKSKLRIAVIGLESPEAGGAFTAEGLMWMQVQKAASHHELIFINPLKFSPTRIKLIGRLIRFFGYLYQLSRYNPLAWAISRRIPVFPLSRFERSLCKRNIDLVFFLGSFDLAIKLKRVPFIATVWDLGHRDLPSLPELGFDREFEFREWRNRNILVKAYAILVDSEVTRKKLGMYYGIDTSTIYSMPFCPTLGTQGKVGDRDSFALYPAHFWSHKNHVVLFNAIKLIISRGETPRRLKLTGLDKGNLKNLLRHISALGIQDYVDFHGFVSQHELDNLYKRAAITLMPTLLGPTNLPPLEALLRGCPVAVSKKACENLGRWSGVSILSPSDVESWSKVLSCKTKFQKVNVSSIKLHLLKIETSNIKKLKSIFQDFEKLNTLST